MKRELRTPVRNDGDCRRAAKRLMSVLAGLYRRTTCPGLDDQAACTGRLADGYLVVAAGCRQRSLPRAGCAGTSVASGAVDMARRRWTSSATSAPASGADGACDTRLTNCTNGLRHRVIMVSRADELDSPGKAAAPAAHHGGPLSTTLGVLRPGACLCSIRFPTWPRFRRTGLAA